MSHDDLIARVEREASIFGDCPVGDVLRAAAAALRELQETQRKFGTLMHETMERAERAEAERDAALDRAESAEASERPLLQVRDELLAENERLRALLREAKAAARHPDYDWDADFLRDIDAFLGAKP